MGKEASITSAHCATVAQPRLQQQPPAALLRPLRPGNYHHQPPTTTRRRGNLVDLVYRQDLRHGAVGQLGRMCFIGSDVSNFSHIVRQVAPPQSQGGGGGVFYIGSRQFHRRHTAHELQRVPPSALARCDGALETRLLRAYFDHVNAGWPVVDEAYFMAHYRGEDAARRPLTLPLLNAVLLVGAHVLAARGDRSLVPLQATLFRRAKTLIDCRFEQDRTMYVQVALLLTWYSDGHEEIVANAWHWIGFAIRIAIGHGMHRDATHSKMLPVHQRLWTRLWWILFQFDTAVSAAYGRPQTLNLDESDVQELQPVHFEGIPNAQVDFATQHAKLCSIFAEAMRTRWALRTSTQSRIDATRRADAALAAFLLQLPPSLRLSTTTHLTPWTATLHLTYNNFVLLLHRAPPNSASADPATMACADPAVCAGAAASMTGVLEALCLRGSDAASLWLYGVHAAFTALVHVSGELAAPSSNPLLAPRAQNMFETLMEALRCLAGHWRFAEGLQRLFRQKAALLLLRDGGAAGTLAAVPRPGAVEECFSLRPPPPPVVPPVEAVTPWESVPGGHVHFDGEDVSPQAADEALQYCHVDLQAQDLMMDEYPDSFALELFLAGMDGSTQDMPG